MQVWMHVVITVGLYQINYGRNELRDTLKILIKSYQLAQNSQCFSSGMWGPHNLFIADTVQIPNNLTPRDNVVGFRWDCEESTQV